MPPAKKHTTDVSTTAKRSLADGQRATATTELFEQLSILLANLHRPREVRAFLEHFLTPAEQVAFARRLGIAKELGLNKSYEAIAKELKVSSATISSVGNALKSAPVQSAMRYLEAENWMRRLLGRAK